MLALQKGLPLAYNRDLQEDKEVVFRADDALEGALEALTGMVATASFHPPLPSGWVTALDLAEALVERGVPFREAHEVVGGVVSTLVGAGRSLEDLGAEELVGFDSRFVPSDVERLDPSESVRLRVTTGGGSFAAVAAQLEKLRRTLSS